ncbi:MAG: sigma 54-interacting transcriptional regulator [Acidobacteriota bacterium]
MDDTATVEISSVFPSREVSAAMGLQGTHLTLTVLYHRDLERVGEIARFNEPTGALSRMSPGFRAPGSPELFLRPLGDPHLSRRPLAFEAGREAGSVRISRCGSTIPVQLDGMPLHESVELSSDEIDRGVVLHLADRVVLLLHRHDAPGRYPEESFGMVGASAAMVRLRRDILRSADLEVPVLLRGETGTGKELVAAAIHEASSRSQNSFVAVNLGAIPPSLAATELFGSVKGAFTGSVRSQMGFFRRAEGGTLFLDEVGEAPPDVQVMLLRVLESGEIQPVGSHETQRVNVRLITATDANLENAVARGRFRAPLLYRLTSGYEIMIPPLRARRDDVGRLLFRFLRDELDALGESHPLTSEEEPWLPASVIARLAEYAWPGNVRELRNVARQLAIYSRGSDQARLGPRVERLLGGQEPRGRDAARGAAEAPAAIGPTPVIDPGIPPAAAYRPPLAIPRAEIREVLRRHRWCIKPASAELGISRSSLYSLLGRYPDFRQAKDIERSEIEAVLEETDGDLAAAADRLEVSVRALRMRLRS